MSLTGTVTYSNLTGRVARVGDVEDQARSTWDKISEAVDARDASGATDLARYALDTECRFVFDLLNEWTDDLRRLVADSGVDNDELIDIDRRLREVLSYPDGCHYDPGRGWATFGQHG